MFPSNGLPEECRIVRIVELGFDASGNMQYGPLTGTTRPCRLYRYDPSTRDFGRQATLIEQMCAFKFYEQDEVDEGMELDVAQRSKIHSSAQRFEIVGARLMYSWKRPSHWEVALTKIRTP